MRQRDEEFEDFTRANYQQLLRYATLLTAGAGWAEDIVQETLIRCLRRWGRIGDGRRLAFARTVLFNEFLRAVRRERRAAPAEQVEVGLDIAAGVVARHDMVAMMGQLPPRQRAAVLARVWLDLSERDTARQMGCTVGTVKSLTSRGLAHLRDLMGQREQNVISTRGTH